jgi:hypothetical protein
VFGNKQGIICWCKVSVILFLVLPLRGSYDAAEMLQEKLLPEYFSAIWKTNATALPRTLADPYPLEHYNMARYQVWSSKNSLCKGKYKASSCVYGIGDLHRITERAELAGKYRIGNYITSNSSA